MYQGAYFIFGVIGESIFSCTTQYNICNEYV